PIELSHPRYRSSRHSSDLAAGPLEAADVARAHRVTYARDNDRDGIRGVLCGPERPRRADDDDGDFAADQVGREAGESVEPALRSSDVDNKVLPVDITALSHALST